MSAYQFLNKSHLRTNLAKAKSYHAHPDTTDNSADFLLRWAEQELSDRLEDIKRDFIQTALISPAPSQDFIETLKKRSQTVELYNGIGLENNEQVPFSPQSQDLIVSLFDIHKINDLPGWLIQIRQSLKEDGVFLACYAGENTLFQLRQSLLAAEMKTMGGASPRVLPFVGKQQISGLLQRTGYALPVVDSETVTVVYQDLYQLMNDIRHMGEANAMTERHKFFTPSRMFFEAAEIYKQRFSESGGKIPATYEITFIIGWAPSDTQQKPLRRGSGQVHLSTILED